MKKILYRNETHCHIAAVNYLFYHVHKDIMVIAKRQKAYLKHMAKYINSRGSTISGHKFINLGKCRPKHAVYEHDIKTTLFFGP